MNKQDTPITEFDCKTTGGSTQLIKAIIPLLNPAQQRMLAIMTRIWELIMTIKFFERTCFQNNGTPLTSNLNPEMINRVKRYCTPESQQTIDMLLNFMNMSELMNMMNMFNGEKDSGDAGGIMDLFKNFSQFTTSGAENPSSGFSGNQDAANSSGRSGFSGDSDFSGHSESYGQSGGYAQSGSAGQSAQSGPFGSFDPAGIMQTMMNAEQSSLYREFMERLDLDFDENE